MWTEKPKHVYGTVCVYKLDQNFYIHSGNQRCHSSIHSHMSSDLFCLQRKAQKSMNEKTQKMHLQTHRAVYRFGWHQSSLQRKLLEL